MKKYLLLFIGLFCLQFGFAQMTNLSMLSSSKYTDSSIIYDENHDVYGYLLLFEKNKIDKNNMLYELVLLDKNLNKVAALDYKQSLYNNMFLSFTSAIYFTKKHGDNLYFLIGQSYDAFEDYTKALAQYKGVGGLNILDLKTFTLKEGVYSNFEELIFGKIQPDLSKSIMQIMKDMEKYKLIKVINEGFLVSDLGYLSEITSLMTNKPRKDHQKAYNFFDFNYQKLWALQLNENNLSKSFFDYKFLKSNAKEIIFEKVFYEKLKDKNPDVTYTFIDITNGKQKFEINFLSKEEILVIDEILFHDQEVVFVASIYDYNKEGEYSSSERRGIAKITVDRNSGKQLNRVNMVWSDLTPKLAIDENGKIKDEGYLHFLEYKILNDGKIIALAEGYKPESSTKILDLYAFTFSSDFKMIDFLKIEKVKNKIKRGNAYGNYLEQIGAFDYMYSQHLDKDNYLFFYSDNEKEGSSARENPNWVLGIVTFIDGKFDAQKIPLTTKNGQIFPSIAKKGYVLLYETFKDNADNNNELRLEKVDY
jgi:hypothetical protein